MMLTQLWLSQHVFSVLDTVTDRVTSCWRYLNNHGWIKITITLQVNYQKSLLHQWARVQCHPGHKTPSTELTTQMQCSSWANTLTSTELTTPVQYSLRVRVKEQTFQIVSNIIFDTSNTASSASNMFLKFPQKCETVWLSLSAWKTLPVSQELTIQRRSQTT